jgi:hypothetical protein
VENEKFKSVMQIMGNVTALVVLFIFVVLLIVLYQTGFLRGRAPVGWLGGFIIAFSLTLIDLHSKFWGDKAQAVSTWLTCSDIALLEREI